MEENTLQTRGVKRSLSVVGFAFSVLIAVALAAQFAILLVPKLLGLDALSQKSWWTWVCASVPMYLFAFPACCLMLHILPGKAPESQKLTVRQFLTLIPISFCLMYAGNLVGTLLSLALSGGQAQNAIAEYAMDQSPFKILVMVILAPLLEELICRKLLIDRTVRYGEKLSVLMSGLIFGLLHQNLFQFFYAFALGSLFAYVYVRTGRVRYTVILHAIVNFLGAVVAPAVISLLNMDAINELAEGEASMELLIEILPGYLVLMAYGTVLLGLSVLGLVLLILKRRKLVWKETEQQLPGKLALKSAFMNVGMIVYILICLVMIVLALFNL
jgi:membrane protease YdiL (CAAX protease family)